MMIMNAMNIETTGTIECVLWVKFLMWCATCGWYDVLNRCQKWHIKSATNILKSKIHISHFILSNCLYFSFLYFLSFYICWYAGECVFAFRNFSPSRYVLMDLCHILCTNFRHKSLRIKSRFYDSARTTETWICHKQKTIYEMLIWK